MTQRERDRRAKQSNAAPSAAEQRAVSAPTLVEAQAVENFGIVPGFIYRRSDPNTIRIIGLKKTALQDAIDNRLIPQPVPLTDGGSACGWLGQTLIDLQRSRLAKAKAMEAAKPARTTPTARRSRS